MKFTCDWRQLTPSTACRHKAVQYVSTWSDNLICRCGKHRVIIDGRKDLREIDEREATVLYVQEQ